MTVFESGSSSIAEASAVGLHDFVEEERGVARDVGEHLAVPAHGVDDASRAGALEHGHVVPASGDAV